ncbi:MAG: fibronectin type III domain-containing protein [Saprospiraceae bacterium]
MRNKTIEQLIIAFLFFFIFQNTIFGKVERLRCMWRDDPTTTMVIGWDQTAGTNPILYYTAKNRGGDMTAATTQTPDRVIVIKGMNNHFVRLKGLRPGTTYFFKIKDSQGSTATHSFQTAPASPYSRLSIIAGGDSRNHREARISANKIVGKLRPHFVLFGGDMTSADVDKEWLDWFDDWQHTISEDRRLTPIVVARGNHEYSNKTLIDLFDVQTIGLYYAHTFGTDMLRIYTLNSLIPSGGKQQAWLMKDLEQNDYIQWKMAQYHHTIRPHTKRKPEKNEMLLNWATLFYKYQVQLVVESDAHVVKTTYPIKPSRAAGSHEGFIRDDELGTVYVGEGCWGAPLRKNDDPKPWTRASGSFNQFKWIFVDREKIEVRTIQTDGADAVGSVDPFNVFIPPLGLTIWEPPTGPVLTIENRLLNNRAIAGHSNGAALATRGAAPMEIADFQAGPKDQDILVTWQVKNERPHSKFEVQRSFGGENYATIGKMGGQAQNEVGNHTYKFVDSGSGITAQAKYIRYRIKYVNNAGKIGLYHPPMPKLSGGGVNQGPTGIKKIMTDKNNRLQIKYQLAKPSNVRYQIFDTNRREVFSNYLSNQAPKNYLKSLDLSELKNGRYVLVIRANRVEIERYQVIKR